MPINISVPDLAELKPRITVFGVGGGGCNAVNNMINSNLSGVEFVVANTDAQALANSPSERKIQMGVSITQGLGAGSQPEIGAAAAEETKSEIIDHLAGSHMVFITAGMGGGTGTGAAPVIASLAREQGILTVGVVTKPFNFEGQRRMAIAERGIDTLAQHVDTLIVIPNQNLFRVANEATSFTAAFQMADQVLFSGVASITELMTREGLINLDFADVRAVMSDMGKAMMGTGEASGESRAEEAALAAISNPLLDIDSMAGARGVLISIAGGPDLTLYEVDQAASRIREEVDPEANIIVGATIEEDLEGTMRVSVVATGLQQEAHEEALPSGRNTSGAGQARGAVGATGMPGVSAPGMGGCIYPAPGGVSTQVDENKPGEAADERGDAPVEERAATDDDATRQQEAVRAAELPLGTASQPRSEEAKPGDSARAREEDERQQHQPAPAAPRAEELAPGAGRNAGIPSVDDLPPTIRELAEQKQERIKAASGASTPQSTVSDSRSAAVAKRGHLLIGKVKELFGRGQSAPQAQAPAPEQRQQPVARAVNGDAPIATSGGAAAAGDAEHSPLGDDDGLNIPAFLRRK